MKRLFIILWAVLLLLMCINSRTNAQSVSQWDIPGNPEIQGLDALYPEDPFNYLYFTEYNKKGIGQLSYISPSGRALSEWKPADEGIPFHPFKIVAGKWNFYSKKDLSILDVQPYIDRPVEFKSKDVVKYLIYQMRMSSGVTFTLPEEGKIGMLIQNPYGAGTYYFWLWTPSTSSGLLNPWDIQRRWFGYQEESAWLSNQEPDKALFQFFPQTKIIKRWDFSACDLEVRVFYVVPNLYKAVTEIWIGGKHKDEDCIAYLKVDKKNSTGMVRIWDIPPTGASRDMNSIFFTHQYMKKTGFDNYQVWLSSSTMPEITILKPNSLYMRKGIDLLCYVNSESYFNAPNGLFWDDPGYSKTQPLISADNNRRMWITSGQFTEIPDFLTANKSEVKDEVTYITCTVQPSTFNITREVIKAKRNDQELYDSTQVEFLQDQVPCQIDRYLWSQPTGLNVDYTGARLDIDMQGRATPSATAGGFQYDIVWHEPQKGRIGMLYNTSPLAAASFEAGYNPSLDDMTSEFNLSQNYPNPFNPVTTIEYTLPEDAKVTLKVYNALGQEVASLLNDEFVEAGEQGVDFNPNNLPSGVYFYRIIANGITQVEDEAEEDIETPKGKILIDVKKMLLLK